MTEPAGYCHAGVTIHVGDTRKVLAGLPDGSVDCCVTSPPYLGLRDYGTAEWDGGEEDCDHVCNRGTQGETGQRADRTFTAQAVYKDVCGKCGARRVDRQIGLEATPVEYVESLVQVFREVRRVLKPEGTLWLNLGDSHANDMKWGGTTGGKHSVGVHGTAVGRGRRRTGLKPKDLIGIPWHVAFALQADGWYLRSDIIWAKPAPMPESVRDRPTRSHEYIFLLTKSARYFYNADAIAEPSVSDHGSGNGYKRGARLTYQNGGAPRGSDIPWKSTDDVTATRNARDVWTIGPKNFSGAHFATFPPELPRRCVLAGCPRGGHVLDPFAGAGTTLLVAKQLGCRATGVELNPKYAAMAARRLTQDVLEFGHD